MTVAQRLYAASTGKAAVVERLLLANANIALETLDGFSALDMAATVECLTAVASSVAKASGAGRRRWLKTAAQARWLGRKDRGSAIAQASLNRRSSAPARRAPGASGG